MLERAQTVRKLQMTIKFEVEHTHTLTALAAAGISVGILPKVALPASTPPLIRSVCIVTLKGQSFSPAARALSGAVRKFLKARD